MSLPLGCYAANNVADNGGKRNVLVILCDQLRPDFLNIYGGKMVETEGINRLAQMGVVFDNATTASPVSGPARASIMTGLYPSSHGVWTNDHVFNEGLDYLPKRMTDNGYITAAFGKLHHAPANDSKGFNIYIPMEESRLKDNEPYVRYMRKKYPDERIQRYNHFSKGLSFAKPMNEHYDYWTTDNALGFLDDFNAGVFGDRPFFLWLSLQGPHGPYDPPKELKGSADESKIPDRIKVSMDELPSVIKVRSPYFNNEELLKKERLAYAEKIKLEDNQTARVLDFLKENGLLENTTIIFSADHGDQIGDHNQNQKGPFPYPYHQNIPMIVANHPDLKNGDRCDALVSNLDIAATCLEIANDTVPLGLSRSMSKMVNDKSFQREVNFAEFCDSYKMVEDKQYRMAYFPFEGEIMLYDKVKDPYYNKNLGRDSKYDSVKLSFMKHLMDFQIICKGIKIEAQDFTNEIQKEVIKKNPYWKKDFKIYFPLTYFKWKSLKENGVDNTYNDFCIPMKVENAYGVFWEDSRYGNIK